MIILNNNIIYTSKEILEMEFPKNYEEGYVYLIYGNNIYKIGSTKDVYKRFDSIQAESPTKLQLVYYELLPNYKSIEIGGNK